MSGVIKKGVIAGVGLIGGSFARAAKKAGLMERVVGFSRNEVTLQKALDLKIIDAGFTDLAQAAAGADFLFAATPVSSVVDVCLAAAPHLVSGAIITDGGSVKGDIVAHLDRELPENVRFVGGHPVAGTEKSGPEAAFATLYRERYTILTPTEKTDADALLVVRQLWEKIGATVIEMSPAEHDAALAVISHLPHMVAYALVETLAEADPEGDIGMLTAGGFRDATRIAASHPGMWRAIFEKNREETLKAMKRYEAHFATFRKTLEAGAFDQLEERLKIVAECRRFLGGGKG